MVTLDLYKSVFYFCKYSHSIIIYIKLENSFQLGIGYNVHFNLFFLLHESPSIIIHFYVFHSTSTCFSILHVAYLPPSCFYGVRVAYLEPSTPLCIYHHPPHCHHYPPVILYILLSPFSHTQPSHLHASLHHSLRSIHLHLSAHIRIQHMHGQFLSRHHTQ